MNIYIDFEANGATQAKEIISIGAVAENGEKFYSLVRPHTKLDHKIKELTHITQEEAEVAPSIESVMGNFFKWLLDLNGGEWKISKFLVYGSCDKEFIDGSISFVEDEVTITRLQKVRDRIERVDKRVSKKFNRDLINLRSAYLTMKLSANEAVEWQHNALEDAEMLKYVWEHIDEYELPEGVIPVKVPRMNMSYGKKGEGKNISTKDSKYQVGIRAWHYSRRKGHREWVFPNVGAASGLICYASNKKKRIAAMDKILAICEAGKGNINGRHFAFIEGSEQND